MKNWRIKKNIIVTTKLGLRTWELGTRNLGLGCWMLDIGFGIRDAGCGILILDPPSSILNTGSLMLDAGCSMSSCKDLPCCREEFRFWILDFGFETTKEKRQKGKIRSLKFEVRRSNFIIQDLASRIQELLTM